MGDYHLFEDDDTTHFLESGELRHRHKKDLDKYLIQVYNYFVGKGFFCIALTQFLNLISLLWVVTLVTFLVSCVNYEILFSEYSLEKALEYKGLSTFYALCLAIFCIFWVIRASNFIADMRENLEIRYFYEKELKISSEELKTIEWKEVSRRIIQVPGLCLSKEKMTHLDIVNRIMRKENYMIILINKDILQLRLPLPFVSRRNIITKTLELSLHLSIFNSVFDGEGINSDLKDPSKSSAFASKLQSRFRFFGFAAFLFSPFVFIYLLISFIFQHGENLRSNPTNIASRQWSPFAHWKIRGLNELPHLLQRRLQKSSDPAEKYVQSFPYPFVTIFARFTSFIVGSVIVVIIALSLWNDNALMIDISGNISTLWVLGVGGSILAFCRAFIPSETSVFEPAKHMGDVVEHTHYLPESWKGKEHTYKVMREFTQLFQYKLVIFFTEISDSLQNELKIHR